jgi:HD-like signal output (HDOD) protein
MKPDHASPLLKELESGYSLPALSPIAMRLIEMASDDMCSVHGMASLIEKDPSLTVRLLRLANSALFRSGYDATSLEQAIVRIGLDRLRIMGLSLSLRDTFPMGRVGPMDYERYWRSSLYQAALAKSLADRLGRCNPEEAFIAGLTLEIGLLILLDIFVKKEAEDHDDLQLYPLEPLLRWEKEQYGVDHREVGQIALRHWKFPESIVSCQGSYGVKTKRETSPLSLVCDVARELSALLCKEGSELPAVFDMAQVSLGLDHDVVNDILITTLQQVDGIAESLKLEVDRDNDVMELVEKANRALSRLSEKISTERPLASGQGLPSFPSLGQETDKRAVVRTLQAVAHEIRNPLVAVGGFARRLALALDPDSEQGRYVRVILEESKRLEQVLQEMTGEASPEG